MFILIYKISKQEKFDYDIFRRCLKFNAQIAEITKILIISDIFIDINDIKLLKETKNDISNIDILEYSKSYFPNLRRILADPHILIKEDLKKLDSLSTKYTNEYITILNSKNIEYIKDYNFNIEILLYKEPKIIEKDIRRTVEKYVVSRESLTTIIISYNYLNNLKSTININKHYLDNIIIVTDLTDIETKEYCLKNKIKFLSFDIQKNGILNKSKAINLAIDKLSNKSFILLLDSDIILSKRIDVSNLDVNTLYTATRLICSSIEDYNNKIFNKTQESKGLGFFQLFHYSNFKEYPKSEYGRFSENSVWSDKIFSSYFKKNEVIQEVYHIGDVNQKWVKKENKKEEIFVGIASIPSRRISLKQTIESLIDQVDNIGVYLNGWGNNIPSYLIHDKITIVKSEEKGDVGDAGKFYWVESVYGYYFTCDDDIIYPSDYIQRTISKINFYNKEAVIGFHGSRILDNFTNYYSDCSRKMYSFRFKRPNDEFVHILGTGTIGFHTTSIDVSFDDFKIPNIADVNFAVLGQKQEIPFIVQRHEKGEMIQTEVDESISMSAINNIKSKMNTADIQNQIVKNIKWKLNTIENENDKLKILLIGRFDNFKKGGIYKSNHMIKEVLTELGHKVFSMDSSCSNYFIPDDIDLCIIYPGDTTRPDFLEAEQKMFEVQRKNIPICINMSYNNEISRTNDIYQRFVNYNKDGKSKIFMLTFSEDVKLDPLLSEFSDFIIPFPKTIQLNNIDTTYSFDEREGIVLGDIAKLENRLIVNGDAQEWIDELLLKMPDVNIYAYMQYGRTTKLKNLKLVPYMKDGFIEWLSNKRISICLNQKLSFEMLPVESQLLGIPVLYRDMPQSLNQWIGHTGICVNTPKEMAEMTYWVYSNKEVWESYSKLGILNSERNSLDNVKIAMEASIRRILTRI